jgi:hypothetical protein
MILLNSNHKKYQEGDITSSMNIRPAEGNVNLNMGMAWQKWQSTRRLFLPSNWAYI